MGQTNQNMDWYQLFKDIVIPGLGVVSTIIIGIVIAIILKRREEKSKIKALLIDNYMLYLNKRSKFTAYESYNYAYEIFKELFKNDNLYFENKSNWRNRQEQIQMIRDSYKEKIRSIDDESINWSPFTFIFCFLLGTKKYKKGAQTLENVIVENITNDKERNNFIVKTIDKIKKDSEIQQSMSSNNKLDLTHGVELIEKLIAKEHNRHQFMSFNPYDNKIADLIDKY